MGQINQIQESIFNLISNDATGFNQGFYEKPKEITDEKLPAYVVYFDNSENEILSSNANKRVYNFTIDIIYDKENLNETRQVITNLLSDVLSILESRANITLGGLVRFLMPTSTKRVEDYQIAGKHYLAYSIKLPAVLSQNL